MRIVAGLLFVASAWSGTALAAGGYTKLEESELTKLYGLRRSIDLPRATALLKIGLEEHIAPEHIPAWLGGGALRRAPGVWVGLMLG